MKRIKDFEDYGITSCGRVWSFKSNKFLKPRANKSGYLYVNLYSDGKVKTAIIHRLVAEAYIPNPEGLRDVDHVDGNRKHNYIGNLQWMTHADNVKKGSCKKVRCIETNQIFSSFVEAAKSVNKQPTGISACIRGKQQTCGGFHWEVIE